MITLIDRKRTTICLVNLVIVFGLVGLALASILWTDWAAPLLVVCGVMVYSLGMVEFFREDPPAWMTIDQEEKE